MNNIWHSIDDDRIKDEDFIVCVEIPKGSKKKYESSGSIGANNANNATSIIF